MPLKFKIKERDSHADYISQWTNLVYGAHFNKKEESKIISFFKTFWNKFFKKKEKEIDFGAIAFPMVRQVFARTLASDIVSVQPLSLPSELLYYMDKHEHENVYNRVVLFEKTKKLYSRYSSVSISDTYYNFTLPTTFDIIPTPATPHTIM